MGNPAVEAHMFSLQSEYVTVFCNIVGKFAYTEFFTIFKSVFET